MSNPFEIIDARLSNIENLLIDAAIKKTPVPHKDPLQPNYITRKEAAKILRLGLTRFNELTKSGVIPTYRIGCNVRLIESEVRASLSKVKTNKGAENE